MARKVKKVGEYPITYPYTPIIGGPTIIGHLPHLRPAPKPSLVCSNCGKTHYSGYSLSQCDCYNEIYDACLG